MLPTRALVSIRQFTNLPIHEFLPKVSLWLS